MEGNDPMRTFTMAELRGMVAEGCQGHAEANAALAELCRRAYLAKALYRPLANLVGDSHTEGDLFSASAHAAARAAIAKAEG